MVTSNRTHGPRAHGGAKADTAGRLQLAVRHPHRLVAHTAMDGSTESDGTDKMEIDGMDMDII